MTSAGASLVAITPELPDHTLTTIEKNQLVFEVLSDVDNAVARQFGIVFELPEDLRSVYQSFGIDLPGTQGNTHFELPIPGTFVIDPKGKVVVADADPDYTKRLEPDEIVTALQSP
jgi:peroxiredoxin